MPENTPSRPAVAARLSDTPRAPSRGFYQCGVCKKEYGRADHLIRHVRSHTADKPFSCDKCGKGFTRIDLLRRHVQSHSATSSASPGKGRVSQACKSCAASKLKCDDEKPCRRCVRRHQTCQPLQRDNYLHNTIAHEQEDWSADQSEQEKNDTFQVENEPDLTRKLDEGALGNAGPDIPTEDMTMTNEIDATSINSLQCESPNQEMASLNAFPLMNYDEWNIFGGIDLDFGLTDEDLQFLGTLDRQGPPRQVHNISEPTTRQDVPIGPQSVPIGPQSPDQAGGDMFQESPLSNWTPRAEDNAYMDQQYLSVPKHLNSPRSTDNSRPRIFAEPLSRESRDGAFAVVVRICQRKSLTRIMQCFPSSGLLDSLINDYFIQQRSEIDAWIHESTLQLNQESPEMILSLAAAGAILSEVEAIQRLGYAMLEVARLQINIKKYEGNNTLTRHLKETQEYILILQIGLWSGDKRRVEIAESFTQPVVTMLRRSSRLKHEDYSVITPTITDDDATLNRKWHEWVKNESFKRLAHHMFIHDVQASVLRSTNPLMSYVELDLPLPFSRKLWDARTAAQWRSIYLQEVPKTSLSTPSLATSLQDISSLSRLPRHTDFQLAALASIHGISTMITDCGNTRRGPCGQWSALVMKVWQQELQQVLEQFDIIAVEPLHCMIPAIPLIYQTVSLSLYIPLGVLETFSGKEGEKRSSNIYKSFIQHISTANLRQASWHAGQVLRIARSMPPGSLTAFCAICLYYAALALWSFGTVFSLKGLHPDTASDNDGTLFLLDGETDSAALRRFTVSGQGIPALSSSKQRVHLNDRAAVMGLFQELLRSKHRGGTSDQQTRALNQAFSVLGNNNIIAAEARGQQKRKAPGS